MENGKVPVGGTQYLNGPKPVGFGVRFYADEDGRFSGLVTVDIAANVAIDAAGNQFNDTITVNYSPLDTTAPLVTIKSPTTRSKFRTNNSSINLSGSASDNVGVSQVNWINSQGGNGTASGTSSWSVSTIPLLGGENILTITAKDATGNQSTDKLIVVRKSTGKRRRK